MLFIDYNGHDTDNDNNTDHIFVRHCPLIVRTIRAVQILYLMTVVKIIHIIVIVIGAKMKLKLQKLC